MHKPFSFDFFFVKIAINEKGEISAIPMMTIMTMISPFDRPRSHRGLASAFSSEESAISMYSIFTCAINAEILWRADTSEGSFGVVAYEAAVTVVFSCYTLVYVCKTEVHATI